MMREEEIFDPNLSVDVNRSLPEPKKRKEFLNEAISESKFGILISKIKSNPSSESKNFETKFIHRIDHKRILENHKKLI